MTATPTISIIVLFHNAETTIGRTLRSLVANSCDSCEFLLVDDGSTDGSAELVKSHIARHPDINFRLIQLPECSGTAEGTRIGLENATGDYIMRCDADDYLDPDTIERLTDCVSNTDADVVIFPLAYETTDSAGNILRQRIMKLKAAPASLNDMPIDTLHFQMGCKLIRRSLIIGLGLLPFPGIDRWEDLGVVARVFMYQPKIVTLDKPVYHYTWTKGSTTLSRGNRERILRDHIAMARALEAWAHDNGMAERYEPFLTRLKFCAKVKLLRHPPRRLQEWKDTFPEVNRSIMGISNIPWIYRAMFRIAAWL